MLFFGKKAFLVGLMLLLTLGVMSTECHALDRTVTLLDLTERKGESDSKLFSLNHALQVAGIPFSITDDIDQAIRSAVVVASSEIYGSTLTLAERQALTQYVADGGTFVVPGVMTKTLHALFGISGSVYAKTRHVLRWNIASQDPTLHWFEDVNEQEIRLGSPGIANVIGTWGYLLKGATPLAFFDDGSVAVTKRTFGTGQSYALGFSFKDLILRNQLNQDYSAQRTYSNGFEPTSDAIILFLRAIYEEAVAYATWKHTSPYQSNATLMITHDVDCSSSMKMMGSFARMEQENGVVATYNITTHYLRDKRLSAFYTTYFPMILDVVAAGQKIGSHSVGHFPDWNKSSVFPLGTPGNTREAYLPYYDGTRTVGGSVYGEVEVSKKVLEEDIGCSVHTFRSGHLLFNKYQMNVLDASGYKYDSSMSANDVLTNFPYICRYSNSYHGTISNVYEIPMTISDAHMTADNVDSKVANWIDVITRNASNYAPTVLLIHPNYNYKLEAQQKMMALLSDKIYISDMDSFGDYWANRDRLTYSSILLDNILTISIPASLFPLDTRHSIYVKNGAKLSSIVLQKGNKVILHYTAQIHKNKDLILHTIRE